MTKEELKQEAEDFLKKFLRVDDDELAFVKDNDDYKEEIKRLVDFAKPREKRIKELETEVNEWKDKADLWQKTANLKDHNILINKELEKENARLKLELEALDGQIPWKDIKDKSEVIGKLTEAKEIIKDLVDFGCYAEDSTEAEKKLYYESWIKAENFLKDNEVEK